MNFGFYLSIVYGEGNWTCGVFRDASEIETWRHLNPNHPAAKQYKAVQRYPSYGNPTDPSSCFTFRAAGPLQRAVKPN